MNNLICPFCGGALVWGYDCQANEISDLYSEYDAAVASYYDCQTCGRSYEIIEPTKEERETTFQKYWYGNDKRSI